MIQNYRNLGPFSYGVGKMLGLYLLIQVDHLLIWSVTVGQVVSLLRQNLLPRLDEPFSKFYY